MICKIWFGNQVKNGNSLKRTWTFIRPKNYVKRIEIVYDSYLKNSIQESKKIQKKLTVVSIKTMNLNLDSLVPLEIKKFWASSINTENFQLLSKSFFIAESKEAEKVSC